MRNATKATHQHRRPAVLQGTLTCLPAGLLFIMGVAMLVVGALDLASEPVSPVAVFGAAFISLSAAALLLAEYRSLFRHSCRATGAVAIVFVFFLISGLVGLLEGFLGLIGVMKLDNDFKTWEELAIFIVFLAYLAAVSWLHIQRWRRLQAREVQTTQKPTVTSPDATA